MSARSTERPNEELARQIVSTVLGVPVDRFEDGKANRQVDALIRYRDSDAALEVVADDDEALNRQGDALRRRNDRLEVPGLRQSWGVILRRKANIKRVAVELPDLLLAFQDDGAPAGPRWKQPPQLQRLHVSRVWPIPGTDSGRAHLHMEPWWGFAGDEHTVAEWVAKVLTEQSDVPAKLAAHSGVAERHAFIWARPSTNFGVQAQLEPGDDHPFPVTPPTLPNSVTHVWIAGHAWFQGVLAWFPDRGWWRPPWKWRH
jgi:hypothetical protein